MEELWAAQDAARKSESDDTNEEVFVKPSNGVNPKIHIRATMSWLTPSFAWTTRCGWRFSKGQFVLLDKNVLDSEAQWCAKCVRKLAAEPEGAC